MHSQSRYAAQMSEDISLPLPSTCSKLRPDNFSKFSVVSVMIRARPPHVEYAWTVLWSIAKSVMLMHRTSSWMVHKPRLNTRSVEAA